MTTVDCTSYHGRLCPVKKELPILVADEDMGVFFLPSLAGIHAEAIAYLCVGHVFSWQREGSSGGISGWFFTFHLRCGLFHFCWHSIGQSKSEGHAWHQWEKSCNDECDRESKQTVGNNNTIHYNPL